MMMAGIETVVRCSWVIWDRGEGEGAWLGTDWVNWICYGLILIL